jgi:hypothetical protein
MWYVGDRCTAWAAALVLAAANVPAESRAAVGRAATNPNAAAVPAKISRRDK